MQVRHGQSFTSTAADVCGRSLRVGYSGAYRCYLAEEKTRDGGFMTKRRPYHDDYAYTKNSREIFSLCLSFLSLFPLFLPCNVAYEWSRSGSIIAEWKAVGTTVVGRAKGGASEPHEQPRATSGHRGKGKHKGRVDSTAVSVARFVTMVAMRRPVKQIGGF